MKNNVTFLIVTPSYNQGQFIEQTIKSVIKQYASIEYIVVDGASNDETLSILKRYKTIKSISEKDNGQTDAINKGIAYFKKLPKKVDTDYIFAYINSDDYYLANSFTTVATAFANEPNKQWLVGEYQVESHNNQFLHRLISAVWKKILKSFYSMNLLLIANPIAQPATFIRWEALEHIGNFNEKLNYVMDYEYWLRLQNTFGNPIFLNKQLASFRIHSSSKGGSQFKKQFHEQYQVATTFTKNFFILGLHKLHNWLTIKAYTIMK